MTDTGQRPTAQGSGLDGAARAAVPGGKQREPHSAAFLAAVALVLLAFFAGFVALGVWQVERRAWKLELIERVESRVHAPAVPAPGPDQWAQVDAPRDAYRHVTVTGTFLHDSETLVQATTGLGGGYWVLTPLQQADGTVVLVNRGFVPPAQRARQAHAAGESEGPVTVTGLLRVSEPDGTFMRDNDPEGDRWYSRDVEAIAAARGLDHVAPYFIDADAAPGQAAAPATAPASASASGAAAGAGPVAPVGGLTVIAFHNNHLVYAITWFVMALMMLGVGWYVLRDERALRRQRGGASRAGATIAHGQED